MKIGVSACLLGENCKYNGKNNYSKKIKDFLEVHEPILICPEVTGGLPTPRTPAEIQGDRVINKDGKDVTFEFKRGAKKALKILQDKKVSTVLLKSKSPSCGLGLIYDGTFRGKLIKGDGVFAKLAKDSGIKVISSDDI